MLWICIVSRETWQAPLVEQELHTFLAVMPSKNDVRFVLTIYFVRVPVYLLFVFHSSEWVINV
jgi:hypothetical protein